MVCIAAFIILGLTGIIAAFLSIFKRDIGKKWLFLFKKSLHCFTKKVRLQKCDTAFDEDIKTMLLKKVVLKHPKWVKPLSTALEILSVIFVLITVWSLVIAIKSLLAIWVFGTCNVTQPSQCGLGAEACSIDQQEPTDPIGKIGRSFAEWGEIFSAIPDRLKTWNSEEYIPDPAYIVSAVDFQTQSSPDSGQASDSSSERPLAVDIFDPGCSVCLQSYKNQKSSDFFNQHRVAFLIYPIQNPDGSTKFNNSELVTRYIYAPFLYANEQSNNDKLKPEQKKRLAQLGQSTPQKILNRLFTEYNSENINYQSLFNNDLSSTDTEKLLQKWYKEFSYSDKEVKELSDYAHSDHMSDYLNQIRTIVEEKVHAKGIPTLIYDGQKHNGLYKTQ